MKRRPTTEERKTSIKQRFDNASGSLLSFENPLHILAADFTLNELHIITGLSLKTLQRQRKKYNMSGYSHIHLQAFADVYLRTLPATRITRLLIELNNGWDL